MPFRTKISPEKNVAIWLLACSIALLSSCSSCLDEIEKRHFLYDVDVAHQLCGKYRILSARDFKFQWIEDLPLSACDGFFAVSPETEQFLTACAKAKGKCK